MRNYRFGQTHGLRFCLMLACMCIGVSGARAQSAAEKVRTVLLPSGHQIAVLSTKAQQGRQKQSAALAKIKLASKSAAPLAPQDMADAFFNYVWGPQVESQDGRRARIEVSDGQPGTKPQSFTYVRKSAGLWLPEGHAVPDWLKAPKTRRLELKSGPAVWLEAERQAHLTMAGTAVPQYDLLLQGGLVGLNGIVAAANAFLATRKQARSDNTRLVSLNLYGVPRQAGFHFRPLTRFWQAVPKTGKPWLLVKFQKSFVMASKAFVLIMTYVPATPFSGIKRDELYAEAERLMNDLGRERADKLGARFASIVALWPGAQPNQRAKGFSTVFERTPEGTWKRSEK